MTWVAGQMTSYNLNTQVRDNLNAIGGVWPTYTPTWTASTTAPALGNGTWAAAAALAGKTIIGTATLTMGSTTTFGAGSWEFGLPAPATGGSRTNLGSAWVQIGTTHYVGVARLWTSTTCRVVLHGTGDLTTALGTWAAGDSVSINFTYQGA